MRQAEGLAQRGLHRPRILEEIGVRVGHHVGRHGQRQQQCPREEAASGKAAACYQPPGCRAADGDANADENDERQRIGHVSRQHGGGEMHPCFTGAEGQTATYDRRDRKHRQKPQHDREAGEEAAATVHAALSRARRATPSVAGVECIGHGQL